jgi:hypothetical protein
VWRFKVECVAVVKRRWTGALKTPLGEKLPPAVRNVCTNLCVVINENKDKGRKAVAWLRVAVE